MISSLPPLIFPKDPSVDAGLEAYRRSIAAFECVSHPGCAPVFGADGLMFLASGAVEIPDLPAVGPDLAKAFPGLLFRAALEIADAVQTTISRDEVYFAVTCGKVLVTEPADNFRADRIHYVSALHGKLLTLVHETSITNRGFGLLKAYRGLVPSIDTAPASADRVH